MPSMPIGMHVGTKRRKKEQSVLSRNSVSSTQSHKYTETAAELVA